MRRGLLGASRRHMLSVFGLLGDGRSADRRTIEPRPCDEEWRTVDIPPAQLAPIGEFSPQWRAKSTWPTELMEAEPPLGLAPLNEVRGAAHDSRSTLAGRWRRDVR